MIDSYFSRVCAQTGTRFWVNNPTLEELELALAHGAAGCTTNPAYGGNLVKRAPEEILPIVETALKANDDDQAVAYIQERLAARIAERFMPLYEASSGREGFVSLQGAPEADTDGKMILAEALTARGLSPNVAPKIPATQPGLEAMDTLVAAGHPVIVTEVFSLAQLVHACERWLEASKRGGIRPPFFVSPITGIFGDHLKKIAARDHVDAPAALMEQVGVLLARRCYALVRDRSYPVTLLFGGARIRLDFTGLVGGGMVTTINWSTAAELIEANPEVRATIEDPVDSDVERRLIEAFPDVRRALAIDDLKLSEFAEFGPVQHFRNNFIAGWHAVIDLVRETRAATAAAATRNKRAADEQGGGARWAVGSRDGEQS